MGSKMCPLHLLLVFGVSIGRIGCRMLPQGVEIAKNDADLSNLLRQTISALTPKTIAANPR